VRLKTFVQIQNRNDERQKERCAFEAGEKLHWKLHLPKAANFGGGV
jgi:hypothetical protein